MSVLRYMPSVKSLVMFAALSAVGCGGAKLMVPNASARVERAVAPREIGKPLKMTDERPSPVQPELSDGALLPVSGDPDSQALQQTRLVPTTCNDLEAAERALIESRVQAMRIAMAQSLEDWRDEQPGCWAMYREQEREWRELRRDGGYGYGYGALAASGSSYVKSTAPVGRSAERPVQSASSTNNQVAGVDEADIVKHDGSYVYFAVKGALRIASVEPPRVVSVTKISGTVKELFVEGNRAVVYTALGGNGRQRCTYGYDCQFGGDGSRTEILVFDVTNHTAPTLLRRIGLSGSLMAARRIGSAVHTVVSDGDQQGPAYSTWPNDLERCGVLEGAVKARLKRLADDNERLIRETEFKAGLPTLSDGGAPEVLCKNLQRTPISDGSAFTTVVSFDLMKDGLRPTTTTLQSRPGAIFMSENALYVAVAHQRVVGRRGWYGFYAQTEEVSDLHKFRVGSSPEMTQYVGSGVVPGHVLNQFAMDEWYGYLRVATTRGRVPNPKVESAVSVFKEFPGGNLVRIGAVEHLAPGEDIRSVRFDNDRGYVVTFKKTDPLFILDLRQPQNPRVLGELKIPGFSTYLHRIDANHLLSIGLDANDHGDFAFFDGVILQLFDVSNPTEPKLIHKEKIGTRGSSSEAITNHLAFNYFAERGLLAIPMTICEGGGDGSNGNDLTFAGLLVYQVSIQKGFKRLGGVNHGTIGSNCGAWWSNANSAVKRSLFLDDRVWSIAMDRAKVQKLTTLGQDEAELTFL